MKIFALILAGLIGLGCQSAPDSPRTLPDPPPAAPIGVVEPEQKPEAGPKPGQGIYSPEEQRQAWEALKCGGPCETAESGKGEKSKPVPMPVQPNRERLCGDGEWLVVGTESWHCAPAAKPRGK